MRLIKLLSSGSPIKWRAQSDDGREPALSIVVTEEGTVLSIVIFDDVEVEIASASGMTCNVVPIASAAKHSYRDMSKLTEVEKEVC